MIARILPVLLVAASAIQLVPLASAEGVSAARGATGPVPVQPSGTADGRSHLATSDSTSAPSGGGARAAGHGTGELASDARPKPPGQPAVDQPRAQVKAGAAGTVRSGTFDPRFSKEVVGLRDARTQVFANPDGTQTAQISTQPEFYRTSSGDWEKIDTTLVEDGTAVRNKAGAVGHRFAKKANSGSLGEYRVRDNVSVGFAVDGASGVEGKADGDQIRYRDVRGNSDLEMQSTPTGIKETIVLRSSDAPTEWDFPLDLRGLTARLDESGSVLFTDGSGAVQARIPHGFMEDSAYPQAGVGVNSDRVTYSLNTRGGKTVLHVSVDRAWVTDPKRVFPIKVDPSVEDQQVDESTFVQTGFGTAHNTMAEVRAGTWDGGADRAATYLSFGGVSSRFAGHYILGAQLWLANIYSYSCSPRDVGVYPVTQPWSAGGISAFPGPAYGGRLGGSSFAYGYTTCPNPAWVGIDLGQGGRDLVQSWTHGGANYGLTVRASETDSYAWKKFASRNSANPPKLSVTYSPYWATYQVPQAMSVPISSTQDGVMPVTVTNWGRDTWTPTNNYQLTYHLYDSSGAEQSQSMTYHAAVPYAIGYGQSATINMPIKKLPPGNWSIRFDMDLYGNTMFAWQGVPTSGTIAINMADQYPIIDSMDPTFASTVSSLTPVLSFTGHDPDNWPGKGTAGYFAVTDANGTAVVNSGWVGDGQTTGFGGQVSWRVPAGKLRWGQTYKWSASIGSWGNNGPMVGPYTFATAVSQPPVLSHAGAAAIEAGKGFDPVTRNYTATATDAVVKTVGPDLSVVRTYNSLDPRANLAFGTGWTSRLDSVVQPDNDGSGNVVVVYPDGQQVRFGANGDGTYASPSGRFATMTTVAGGGWKLIDKSTTTYTFNGAGKLVSLTDGYGRSVTFGYDGQNRLATMTSSAGGRTLRFTWSGNHVGSVTTDPPDSGGPALSWQYTYDGDRLVRACDPTNACTSYDYNPGSRYQDYIRNTATGYWPLTDAGTGTFAANDIIGGPPAAYVSTTADAANPFGYPDGRSASFNGTSSALLLPADTLKFPADSPYRELGVELWFKTTSSSGGVLIGNSDSPYGTPGAVNKISGVYVGTDGKLYVNPTSYGPGTTGPVVNDGKWHCVTLNLERDWDGSIYLDGTQLSGSLAKPTQDTGSPRGFIGAGPVSSSWTAKPADPWGHFNGQISQVSVGDIWKSGYGYGSTWQLRKITDPAGKTVAQVRYASGTGQAENVTDRNGGSWAMSSPDGYSYGSRPERWRYEWTLGDADSGWFAEENDNDKSTEQGNRSPGAYWDDTHKTLVSGPFGDSAVRFDGVAGGLELYRSDFVGASATSFELWFKTSSTSGGVLLNAESGSDDPAQDDIPILYVGTDGRLYGHFRNGQLAGIVTPNAVNNDAWHHVVLAAGPNNQTLYLDGAAVGSQPGAVVTDEMYFYLGAGNVDGAAWPARPIDDWGRFTGAITHLTFYRQTLSATQVSTHYAARTSLAAYRSSVYADTPHLWRILDSTTEPSLDPNVGAARFVNVALDKNPLVVDGLSGGFNGSTSHVELPAYHLAGRTRVTTEMWFQTSTAGGVLLGSSDKSPGEGTPTAGEPLLYVGTDGKLYGHLGTGSTEALSTRDRVDDGQWHYVALVGLGSSQSMYLDGQVVGHLNGSHTNDRRRVLAGAGWVKSAAWPARPADDWGHFTGTIAELAFYPRSLSPAELAEHFHAGQGDSYYVRVWDPNGKELIYGFDHGRGDRPTYTGDANGNSQYYEYDSGGFLARVIDANGHFVQTGHDARGNVVSQATCRSRTECYTSYYDYYLDPANPSDPRNDLLIASRDARSANKDDTAFLTRYTYTPQGDLATVTGPSTTEVPTGRVSTNRYTAGTEAVPGQAGTGTQPAGLLASTTDPAGGVTSYGYNRFGDLAEVVDPAGKITRIGYDGIGRPVSQTVLAAALPGGSATTTRTYDGASRVLSTTGPATTDAVTGAGHQLRVSNAYNADGTVASRTNSDVTGNDPTRTTTYGYDNLGRLASVTGAEGGTTTYRYDSFGNPIGMVDALGHEVLNAYTPTGKLATVVVKGFDGDGAAARDVTLESRAYDPADRLASITDAMGRTTALRYFDDDLLAATTQVGYRDPNGTTRDVPLATYQYDGQGNQTRTETGGVVTQRAWDAEGNLTRVVTDPTGTARTTAYTYDALDNPITVARTDSSGASTETTDLGYDPMGRVTRQVVHNGTDTLVTTTARDQAGLPTAVTDPRGATPATAAAFTTTFGYDSAARLISTTMPAVTTESNGAAPTTANPALRTGFNTFGEAVEAKDPNGNLTTTSVDKLGRPTTVTRPAYTAPGATAVTSATVTAYDKLGRVSSVTDAAKATTSFDYDVLGNLTRRTDPVVGSAPAGVSTFRYDPLGELLSATGATGATTTATYDDLGRQVTSTVLERNPAPGRNLTTATTYNDSGTISSVKTPNGAETTYTYNGVGEPVSTTDPLGKKSTAGYDLAGRLTRLTDPLGLGTRIDYDQAGRPTTVSSLDTDARVLRSNTTAYDPAGNVVSRTDPLGVAVSRQVDALGRTTGQTEPVSATASISTTFGYDTAGNQTRYTDGNGNRTITTYNPWNLPESVIEPATSATPGAADRTYTTGYDAMGRANRLIQPGGVVRTKEFDALGNVTKETGTGAAVTTPNRVLGYDRAGRMTSVSAGAGTNTYTYDDRGNLIGMAGPAGTATTGYDDNGRMASHTDASGTTTYTYDLAGHLATAVDPRTGSAATYSYDAAGQPTTVGYGAGNGRRSYTYDNLHRVASDTVTNATGMVTASISYGYDNADRVTAKTTTGLAGAASNTYGYDQAGRLTRWDNGTGASASNPVNYTWDTNGNRLTAGSVTATYDQRNRTLTSGGSSYTYTPRGTLATTKTGKKTVTQQFDAFDRMVADNGRTYTYDGLDRLIGGGLAYAGQGNTLAADGTATYSRLPGGQLLGLTQSSVNGLAFTDAHTDLVGTYTPTGAIADSAAYTPHGQLITRTGPSHALGYQSGWTDPTTGKVNMAARWYDPTTGAFASRDDIQGPSGPGSAGQNRYLYGLGDPVAHTDPTGHFVPAVAAVAAVAAPAAVPALLVAGTTLVVVGGGYIIIDNAIDMIGEATASKSFTGGFKLPAVWPTTPGAAPVSPRDVPSCASVGCWRSPVRPVGPGSGPTPRKPTTPKTGTRGGGGGGGTTVPVVPDRRAMQVLINALTPLIKPPSGPTIAPDIKKLIDDAGTTIATIIGGQTEQQTQPRPTPGIDPTPLPAPDADNDPRNPKPPLRDRSDRCVSDWQRYGDMQEVIWDGDPGRRATGGEACVVTTQRTKQPGVDFDPFGLDTKQGMARCHLIGHKLNGSSEKPENIVPCYQNPTNNSWMYHRVEARIADQVDSGNPVYMTVVPVYPGQSPRPVSISMTAVGNNGWTCNVSIPNVTNADVVSSGLEFSGC